MPQAVLEEITSGKLRSLLLKLEPVLGDEATQLLIYSLHLRGVSYDITEESSIFSLEEVMKSIDSIFGRTITDAIMSQVEVQTE